MGIPVHNNSKAEWARAVLAATAPGGVTPLRHGRLDHVACVSVRRAVADLLAGYRAAAAAA